MRGGGDFGGRGGRGDFGGRGGGGRGRGPPPDSREQDPNRGAQEFHGPISQIVSNQRPEKLANGRVKRPSTGTVGRRAMITVNHFMVEFNTKELYHYDIDIKPIRYFNREGQLMEEEQKPDPRGRNVAMPARLGKAIMNSLAQQERWEPGWVYDGKKNLFSRSSFLPQAETKFTVALADKAGEERQARPGRGPPLPRKFSVATKWVATVDVTNIRRFIESPGLDVPREAIQGLDIAMRHGATMNPECTPVGRGFYFYDPQGIINLGGGAEAWMGYRQSLTPCQFGLSLQMDTAATAFVEANDLVPVMAKLMGMRDENDLVRQPMNRQMASKLYRAINGLRVEVTHRQAGGRGRTRGTISGITDTPASETMFKSFVPRSRDTGPIGPEGPPQQEQSVADYFRERYHALRFPQLPCIIIGKGRAEQKLPPEVCRVVPGQRRLKLDEMQTASMIKIAAQNPMDRRRNIEYMLNEKSGLLTDETIRNFGGRISPNMLQVEARVLPQPRLQYAQPQCMDPGTQGSWNLKQTRFFKGSELRSWALVSFAEPRMVEAPGEGSLRQFADDLVKMLNDTGVSTKALPPLLFAQRSMTPLEILDQAVRMARQQFSGEEPQLLLVILPSTAAELYKEVKRITDSHLGVPSQCIVMKKAGIGQREVRGRLQYVANVAMKINAKLGGTNQKLLGEPLQYVPAIGARPFMVIGADVTHPISFNRAEPSVAAIVGSVDKYCARYSTRVQIQGHRMEVIQNLKDAIRELLLDFYRYNGGRKPEALVVYRDGISESMFTEVMAAEYASIREAGQELEEGYTPPITYVSLQKRHNTRFFPTSADGADRSGNILPGTVIDVGSVHPHEFDFFLNSHAGLQGTNRTAHYHVLVDEVGFSADSLQLFTYWLCYLFCRCSRSVSIVAPAYYAHLAAFRGKIMVSHSDSSSEASDYTERPATQFASIHQALKGVMFYV